jgi:CxxC motif-containing protein
MIYKMTDSGGWVYAFSNPSMPGLIKIGMTDRTPSERLKELSTPTAIPTPFEEVVVKKVRNNKATEIALHAYLNKYRINPSREFFSISKDEIIQLFAIIDGETPVTITPIKTITPKNKEGFVSFMNECLIKEVGATISIGDVCLRYREWKRFNPGSGCVTKAEIIILMSDSYSYNTDSKVFANVRLKIEGEDEDIVDINGNLV